MNLGEILSGVRLKQPLSPELAGKEIRGIEYDSRRVAQNFLFFAFPGSRTDGRAFAHDASSRGAVAIVSDLPSRDDFPSRDRAGAVWIEVQHGREALAIAARN